MVYLFFDTETTGLPKNYTAPSSDLDNWSPRLVQLGWIMQNEDRRILSQANFIIKPEGYEGQIRGRSGLNCNHDIVCPVGTIDADYRGELKVKLYNLGKRPYIIKPQERVAQLVICPVVQAKWNEVEYMEADTERGYNGIGSTGRI